MTGTSSRPSSLDIAQQATLVPIDEIAARAGILPEELEPYGRFKGKVDLRILDRVADRPDGRLLIVTGITPTRAGEGKTTTAIGLTQGLARLGARSMLCLREPSVGPVFGVKGGATGGGRSQVLPLEDINLNFTGDFPAVTGAHNLLAAALDASLHNGNPLGIEPRSATWPRTLDVNDRALRQVVVGLGGLAHGVPRESGFVITAASEVMAILALASSLADLRERLGRITVAETRSHEPVSAEDLRVAGAMTVVLREAVRPNLVQTLEGQPVLIHTGPFGNIATGNSSILADRVALKLSDVTVTEAGFGSDLGFEKFCHLVCGAGGLRPGAALLVASVRALKVHGGLSEADAGSTADLDALERGMQNLAAHLEIVRTFGLPCVVAVNRFGTDTEAELELLAERAQVLGAEAVAVGDGFEHGGDGCRDLAAAVLEVLDRPSSFGPVNPPGTPVTLQVERIAVRLYGAEGVDWAPAAVRALERLAARGLDRLPVCMAKTNASLSHDPARKGRPRGFHLPVRDLLPNTGAGYVVVLCGDVMLMPGLGKDPGFVRVDVDADGRTVGLF